MRVYCVSDTHGKHGRLAPVPKGTDLVIHAGDLTMTGELRALESAVGWLSEAALATTYGAVFIAGNHDVTLDKDDRRYLPEAANIVKSACRNNPKLFYLENSGVTLGPQDAPFLLWGSPKTPAFQDWAFGYPCIRASDTPWDEIPLDVDILVTHGPPYCCLDRPSPQSESLGCPFLRKALLDKRCLRLHVFGHIHGSGGKKRLEDFSRTRSVNASVLNESYDLVREPRVVETGPPITSTSFCV